VTIVVGNKQVPVSVNGPLVELRTRDGQVRDDVARGIELRYVRPAEDEEVTGEGSYAIPCVPDRMFEGT
jgi:hypothetical protein